MPLSTRFIPRVEALEERCQPSVLGPSSLNMAPVGMGTNSSNPPALVATPPEATAGQGNSGFGGGAVAPGTAGNGFTATAAPFPSPTANTAPTTQGGTTNAAPISASTPTGPFAPVAGQEAPGAAPAQAITRNVPTFFIESNKLQDGGGGRDNPVLTDNQAGLGAGAGQTAGGAESDNPVLTDVQAAAPSAAAAPKPADSAPDGPSAPDASASPPIRPQAPAGVRDLGALDTVFVQAAAPAEAGPARVPNAGNGLRAFLNSQPGRFLVAGAAGATAFGAGSAGYTFSQRRKPAVGN